MATKTQITQKNQPFKLDPNTFSNPGYIFKGWNTDRTSTQILYTDCQENVILNSDITLYAIWEQEIIIKDYIQGYVLDKLDDPTKITEEQLLSFGTRDQFESPYTTPKGTTQQYFCIKKTTLGTKTLTVKNAETQRSVELEKPVDKIINDVTYTMYYSNPASGTTKENSYIITLQ